MEKTTVKEYSLKLRLLIFSVSMFIIGCSSDAEKSINYSENKDLVFSIKPLAYTVFESNYPGTNGKTLENVEVTMFNEPDAFFSFYKKLHKKPNHDFIELDFIKGSVLFIDLGHKASDGWHEIQISSITNFKEITYLELNELSPGDGCIADWTQTRPYVLAYTHRKMKTSLEVNIKRFKGNC